MPYTAFKRQRTPGTQPMTLRYVPAFRRMYMDTPRLIASISIALTQVGRSIFMKSPSKPVALHRRFDRLRINHIGSSVMIGHS